MHWSNFLALPIWAPSVLASSWAKSRVAVGTTRLPLMPTGSPTTQWSTGGDQRWYFMKAFVLTAAQSFLRPCSCIWSSRSFRRARSLSSSRTTSKGWPGACQLDSRTQWEGILKHIFNYNVQIFLSERESSDRNHALAFFMRENGCFPKWLFLHWQYKCPHTEPGYPTLQKALWTSRQSSTSTSNSALLRWQPKACEQNHSGKIEVLSFQGQWWQQP